MSKADYEITVRTNLGFDEAIERVTSALKDQGFGVLTEIDVQATMKEKLNVNVAPYRILGACNPRLAHRALELEPSIGLLLPCNVVVRVDGEETVVSIMDPGVIAQVADKPELVETATEARGRLEKVAAAISG